MTFLLRVNIAHTPSSPRTLSSRWAANGSRSRVTDQRRTNRGPKLHSQSDAQQTSSMNTREEFDYIIVGARSAGCVAMDLFAQPNLSKGRRGLPASAKEADIVAFIRQRKVANYQPGGTSASDRTVPG